MDLPKKEFFLTFEKISEFLGDIYCYFLEFFKIKMKVLTKKYFSLAKEIKFCPWNKKTNQNVAIFDIINTKFTKTLSFLLELLPQFLLTKNLRGVP